MESTTEDILELLTSVDAGSGVRAANGLPVPGLIAHGFGPARHRLRREGFRGRPCLIASEQRTQTVATHLALTGVGTRSHPLTPCISHVVSPDRDLWLE